MSIIQADARHIPLRDGCVQMAVSSPPYWNLRDYRVPRQIGMEGSVEEYVDVLVLVFREVARVLRADGIAWLNLGDSYAGSGHGLYKNGLSQSPDLSAALPTWATSHNWNYVPLILLIVAGVFWLIGHCASVVELLREPSGNQPPTTQPLEPRNPVAPPASPSSIPARFKSGEFLLDLTPQELVKPFDTYLSVQAQRLIQPYIGKRISITGPISDMHQRASGWHVLLSIANEPQPGTTIGWPITVSLTFGSDWSDRLGVLGRGATITAIGEIVSIESSIVSLNKCELISTVNR